MRNLEERLKIDEIKAALNELFSDYGKILDIVAKRNLRAKGQAFVVFDNVESASRAIEEVNGFNLVGKPMVLDYAKTRSDAAVLHQDGPEELEAHKRRRLAEKGSSDSVAFETDTPHRDDTDISSSILQNEDKRKRPSRHRRNSNDQLELSRPTVADLRKPLVALVSNPPVLLRRPSFQTSISLRTRSSSFEICPTISMRRRSRPSSAVSKVSEKCGWSLDGKGLRSSSTRTSLAPSVPRRQRRECLWGMPGSRSGSHISDSRCIKDNCFVLRCGVSGYLRGFCILHHLV